MAQVNPSERITKIYQNTFHNMVLSASAATNLIYHPYHRSIMKCGEGLRVIARFRKIADEDERAGRIKSAKLLRKVALSMECVDYGLYLFEYKYGIKTCD